MMKQSPHRIALFVLIAIILGAMNIARIMDSKLH